MAIIRILRAHGIPIEIVNVIWTFYSNFTCSIDQIDTFLLSTNRSETGVCNVGYPLQHGHWLGTTMYSRKQTKRMLFSTLKDLDFCRWHCSLVALSLSRTRKVNKTQHFQPISWTKNLPNENKSDDIEHPNLLSNEGRAIWSNDRVLPLSHTWVASLARMEVQTWIFRADWIRLEMSMKATQYSTRTKLRIYQGCILITLLYGSECWRMTEQDISRLSSFHTTNLRRILKTFWVTKISTEQLLEETNEESMWTFITRRQWRWTDHSPRKEDTPITKTAVCWIPEGRRKRGLLKTTWRRTVEMAMKETGHTWDTIEWLGRDNRDRWMNAIAALDAIWRDRQQVVYRFPSMM